MQSGGTVMEEAKVRRRAPAVRTITFGRWFGIALPEGARAGSGQGGVSEWHFDGFGAGAGNGED